jgi:nucleoid-associated protein YgaU
MAEPTKATLVPIWSTGDGEEIKLLYNPTELSIEKSIQLAEISIPGLWAPLQQFVRGQAERLTVELFFDTTDHGMGADARSVTEETDKIYTLARVEPNGHAPPRVRFTWGDTIPGGHLRFPVAAQGRHSFEGVVESVKHKFTLFSPLGVPLRATVSLTLREFAPLHRQLEQLNLASPDRTHAHVLEAGQTLDRVAHRYYLRAGDWRPIARENGIRDPRRLDPGVVLRVPALGAREVAP